MTKNEYAEVMQFLEAAYPTKSIFAKEKVVDVWYECLKDLNPQRALEAVKEVSQTEEFPSIAKIRAAATYWKPSRDNDKSYETGLIQKPKADDSELWAAYYKAEEAWQRELAESRKERGYDEERPV